MEDVPEEPKVEPEPELTVQKVEPKHHQETSTNSPQSVLKPVEEPIAALTPPPEEAGLLRGFEEPEGGVLQTETHDPGVNDAGSGLMKDQTEEEKEEAPHAVKEAHICEEPEGMSTLQVTYHTCCQETTTYLY